jgi:hypothetical protein
MDFEHQVALATVIPFENKGQGKGKTILFRWKELAILGYIVEYEGLGVGKSKIAEKQGVTSFPGVLEPKVVARENSPAVAPAQVVEILSHALRQYDGISPLDQRFFLGPRGSACHYHVNVSIDTWMERKDHGFLS